MTVDSPSSFVSETLASCERLVDQGRLVEAVDLLDLADRRARDPEIERRLLALRHAAVVEITPVAMTRPFPEATPFDGTLRDGMPVVAIDDLDAPIIRSAITSHGCVLVPSAVPRPHCERLVSLIERGFDASARPGADKNPHPDALYELFAPPPGQVPGAPSIEPIRLARDSTMWSVDSPQLFQEVCVLLDEVGLGRAVVDYLGERPFISAKKSNLRRVPVDCLYADWHQDGSVLGQGIRTVNVWITLNDCGVDAPGIDIVPRRFDGLLETGTEGASFDWTISRHEVEAVARPDEIVRPAFEAGDALLFDELFLHRTAAAEGMTRDRYAIESWFFAPSHGYGNQVPLLY